jgi:hypothetical protein
MNPKPDATPDDVVARKFSGKNESFAMENEEKKNLTIVEEKSNEEEDLQHEIHKRNILNKMVLTRKGVYRVLESRISA